MANPAEISHHHALCQQQSPSRCSSGKLCSGDLARATNSRCRAIINNLRPYSSSRLRSSGMSRYANARTPASGQALLVPWQWHPRRRWAPRRRPSVVAYSSLQILLSQHAGHHSSGRHARVPLAAWRASPRETRPAVARGTWLLRPRPILSRKTLTAARPPAPSIPRRIFHVPPLYASKPRNAGSSDPFFPVGGEL